MWTYYLALRRCGARGFEMETIAFFLSTLSLAVTCSSNTGALFKQFLCVVLGLVLFLVLGFVMLNRGFGARTVYCSILSAGLIQLFEWAFPMDRPLTDQLMLELFFAVILPALGSAILFNIDASSGGTDIAAMILKKYTGLDVGRALLLSDVVIAAAALFVLSLIHI